MWSCIFRCGFTSSKICSDCCTRNWDPWRPHNWRFRPGMSLVCDGFGWTNKVSLSISLYPLFLCVCINACAFTCGCICMAVYACAKFTYSDFHKCICILLLSWISSIWSNHSDLFLEFAKLVSLLLWIVPITQWHLFTWHLLTDLFVYHTIKFPEITNKHASIRLI